MPGLVLSIRGTHNAWCVLAFTSLIPGALAQGSAAAQSGVRFDPVALHAAPNVQQPPNPTEPGAPSIVDKTPSRAVVSALVPVRPLPVGPVKRDWIVPAFKAEGVGFLPYGFIKVTAAEDSSSPSGDDFPLPGFLCDSGPDGAPEFHLKARSTRFGANFAWYDANPQWDISGKLEMDFEGNFNRSDNRNLSSVRSSNPSLRLAWARLDFSPDSRNTFSALFGEDWSPFASSTLPNLLETTGSGIGFGNAWERTPQMRFGWMHRIGDVKVEPEFALAMPASGLTPSSSFIAQQLGYGERQGPDSNRPDEEARIAVQWQLDPAPGVAPAQLIVSGEHGKRTAIVLASAVPAAYQKTFATGATGSSFSNGWDLEAQLPTRHATLVAKYYAGADLRYFFSGQLYSFFNDTTGLTQTASVASVDGASTLIFGTNAQGQQVVAPERPVRVGGGFAQLGLPLSRLFGARPGSRNAGWTLYLLYGVDQARTRDLNRLGAAGSRRSGSMAVGTLSYSLNRWISFSAEQSLYTTHANPEQPLPLFKGVHAREWNDIRTEFGPVFNF